MIRIIHAKFARDKMRIALGLPEKLQKPTLERFDALQLDLPKEDEIEDDEEEEEEEEEVILELEEPEIEEEEFDEDELAVEEIMDELEESFDEMELADEEILMMPDELPEQLFLSGELIDETDIISESDEAFIDETAVYDPMASLLERARAALHVEEVVEETSEDEIMKMELRDRITAFITSSPDLAIKIFRVFFHQEKTSMKEGRF